MRLTRAGEYAVRCVLYMSVQRDRRTVGRREISEAMDIPHQFLGKIAQDLARTGIIAIRQGAQGGYSLNSSPEEVTLLDVVEAVDGEIFLNDCVGRPGSCERSPLCPVHPVWNRARERLRETLADVTFAALAAEEVKCSPPAPDSAGDMDGKEAQQGQKVA